jgi:hypothetical protein
VSSSQTLSWQGALFNVLGIYSAVIVQGAGAVGGHKPWKSVLLRTSPIVTAVDVVFRIIKFAILKYLGFQTSLAADLVWNEPFDLAKHYSSQSTNILTIESMQQLEESDHADDRIIDKTVWATVVFFVICTLTQGVKLFGCTGIVFTQLIAGIYIFAFLATETLRFMPKNQNYSFIASPLLKKTMGRIDAIQLYLNFASYIGQTATWLWIILKCVPDSWLFIHRVNPSFYDLERYTTLGLFFYKLLLIVVFCPGIILLLGFVLFSFGVLDMYSEATERILRIPKPAARTLVICTMLFLFFVGVTVQYFMVGWIYPTKTVTGVRVLFCIACLWCSGIGAAYLGYVLYYVHHRDWPFSERELSALWFAIMNLASLFLYYRAVYDSQSTHMPDWAGRTG